MANNNDWQTVLDSDIVKTAGQIKTLKTAFSGLIKTGQEMYEAVYEIDTAMTELAKVSDTGAARLSQAFEKCTETAKRYGSTINEVISSTASWSRLGYSMDEAEKLAEAATIYKNIADGIDIGKANSSLAGILRDYKLDADEALHIIDALNEAANTKALDTASVGEALQKSASSMYAAGNTLEETIGLITAANDIIRDSGSIDTAFETISMRIRGAATEMEQLGLDTGGMAESTSALQKEMLSLAGVDIMQDNGTLKSTYRILDELAAGWQDLTDTQQKSITALIAGNEQGNLLSSLLANFETARNATDAAINSQGSAMKEQETYLSSLEAKTTQYQAAFQSLSSTILNSDLLKWFVDFGTGATNVLDSIISGFDRFSSLSGTLGAISGLLMNKAGIGERTIIPVVNCTAPTPLRLHNNAM